ncbi:MAG: MarR family transcriptional regulator [Gammaproteobacteria bacterium]|nr:MarR family transcriptional regulator [Gammaproteobacteria bacterium]
MNVKNKNEIFTEVVLEIFKVGGLLNIEGDKMTNEFGLTASRWKILGAIELSDTPLTISEIGRVMGQSRQAVQRLVDLMTKDKLLQQVENPNHKRAKFVQLTPQAKNIYLQLDKKQIQWAEGLSMDIKKSDLETTREVLKKISDLIDV